MRYLDGRDPFARDRIEASLPSPTAPAPAMALPAPEVKSALQLLLRMVLTPFARAGRGAAKARGRIEEICLAPFQAVRLNTASSEYRLTVPTDPDRDLDEILATLLDDMHRMADTHQCFLEASLSTDDGRHWD
jgi:hypothetical protein